MFLPGCASSNRGGMGTGGGRGHGQGPQVMLRKAPRSSTPGMHCLSTELPTGGSGPGWAPRGALCKEHWFPCKQTGTHYIGCDGVRASFCWSAAASWMRPNQTTAQEPSSFSWPEPTHTYKRSSRLSLKQAACLRQLSFQFC